MRRGSSSPLPPGTTDRAPNTVAHREPWTTTVAASTSDVYIAGSVSLVGSSTLELVGTSVTGEFTAPVVLAADFDGGDPGCFDSVSRPGPGTARSSSALGEPSRA